MSIINIIILFLITVSLLIIIFTSKRSKTPTTPIITTTSPTGTTPAPKKSKMGTIGAIIGMIFGVVLIVYFIVLVANLFKGCEEDKQPSKIVKIGKEKTLYQFSDQNWDRSVLVSSNAEFYPKGGKVKVTTSSGRLYISTPGTSELRQKENPGKFFFEPHDSLAWGVEVWQ